MEVQFSNGTLKFDIPETEIRKIIREVVENALNGNGQKPCSCKKEEPKVFENTMKVKLKTEGKMVNQHTQNMMARIHEAYKEGTPPNIGALFERMGYNHRPGSKGRGRIKELIVELGYEIPSKGKTGRPRKDPRFVDREETSEGINLNKSIESKIDLEESEGTKEDKAEPRPLEISDDRLRFIFLRYWGDGAEIRQIANEAALASENVERFVKSEKSINYAKVNEYMIHPERKDELIRILEEL